MKKEVANIKDITKEQAIESLWRRGKLGYKLRPDQREIYDLLKGSKGMKFVLYCSRRYGKSFVCAILAIEDALQGRKRQIGFLAPTQKQIKRIYFPIFEIIFRDCPKDLVPKWDRDLSCYKFSNGSSILFSGTDSGHYEDLLGLALYRGFCDEPGSMNELNDIINRVLQPQTLTTVRTYGANIILLGTPAPSAAHPYFFIKEMCRSIGNFAKRTIEDNKSLSPETVRAFIEEAGGKDSTDCRREYYCEDVTDERLAIIPEYTEKADEEIAIDYELPPVIQWYTALDPAFNDFSGVVMGYYDFKAGIYVVDRELLCNKLNTKDVADKIKVMEGGIIPLLRVSDTDPQIIADMSQLYGLDFVGTRKDNKQAQINEVRMLIKERRIRINKNCVNLRRQLRSGLWNNSRTGFLRTEDDGHYDLIDALVYLIRNIDVWTNPYPADRRNISQYHYSNNGEKTNNVMEVLFND